MAEVVKADEYSPTRCQAVSSVGQCFREAAIIDGKPYMGASGEYRCEVHMSSAAYHVKKRAANNLRIARYQQRMQELNNNNAVKDLRDETCLLRALLEEIANKPDFNVLTQYRQIGDLVDRIQKCVQIIHKVDKETNELLSKEAVITFAQSLITVLTRELSDTPDKLERIANQLDTLLTQLEET